MAAPALPEPAQEQASFKRGSLENFLFMFLVFLFAVLLCAKAISSAESAASKLRWLLLGVNLIGTVVCFVLLPPPSYKSPVKPFFQLVQALGMMYFFNVLAMALLDSETLHKVLVAIDPRLSQPTTERSYSIDCRVFTPEHPESMFANVRDTLDFFVAAHFFGWAIKTLIFRNNLFAWMMSISFEIYELSLRHWLPNFYECWWDHLFLDLFGCNMLGILLTSWLMNRFKIEKFHWFFDPNERTENAPYWRRLAYSLTQASPYMEAGNWHWLANPTNFLTVSWLVVINSVTDLSNFLNKKMLNIPANHYFLVIRIWIVGFFSILCVAELYEFSRALGEKRKIGFNLALSFFILAAETIIFVRNIRPEFFVAETPVHVKAFWSVVSVLWLGLLLLSIKNSRRKLFKSLG